MKNNNLKYDAIRYLAQQAERDRLLWKHPAGVKPVDLESGGLPTDQQSDRSSRTPPSAISALKKGLKQAREEWVPPAVTSRGKNSPSPWERGAPEPEPLIPIPGQIENPFPDYNDLDSFDKAISGCMKCPLGATRTKFVFGIGDPNADLVLVGEAPGADEDRQGDPFVGRAGKLLDQILSAVDLRRGEGVYIANILKCRPPGNRDPLTSEVEQCEPHLVKQLQLLQPKLIVALGRIAAQTLLRSTMSLTKMRGHVHDYHGIPLLVTFHPAALLRNPQWKRPTWEDVQQMKKLLDELRAKS
ncbi:MAG: uracil-DNA glycosylase [bacterium]